MISGHAIATLVVFIISDFFVVHPISIPTPRPLPRIPINLATAPILAIALLWAAQCLNPAVIRDGIIGTEGVKPYNILITFFSLAYMAITLDITGILEAAAYWVSNKGGRNGWKLYLYFYLLLTLLSIVLGNDPVILFGTKFMARYTTAAELDWRAWVMAEFVAVNAASIVLFVGNPANMVVCEGFDINNAAFTAYTILPFLACSLLCFVALAFQYRNQVPLRLSCTVHQDPRLAIRDPVGAVVGSFMLGTTLVLCLVANFFRADVWMISLPFAVTKLLFDLGRDYYRFTASGLSDRGLPKVVEQGFIEGFAVEEHRSAAETSSYFPSIDEKRQCVEDTHLSCPPSTDEEHQRVDDAPSSYPLSTGKECQRVEDTPLSHPLSTEKEHQHVEDTPSSYSSSTEEEHQCVEETPSSYSSSTSEGQSQPPQNESAITDIHPKSRTICFRIALQLPSLRLKIRMRDILQWFRSKMTSLHVRLSHIHLRTQSIPQWFRSKKNSRRICLIQVFLGRHFPTVITVPPRLPFALVPFGFSQFILVEALNRQGWVKMFATWLVRASHNQLHPCIWLIGTIGVILCNFSGTNLGATILLVKVVRAAGLPYDANRGAAIALAIAANIGAVGFTFSASLSGFLWRAILSQTGIHMRQREFAFWNLLPLLVMTTVGLGVVSAEIAVLFQS